MIEAINNKVPQVDPTAFVARGAVPPEQLQATYGMMERYLVAAVMHGEMLRRRDAAGRAD